MTFQKNLQWLDGGRILAECGPMRLVIEARIGRVPQRDLCIQAASEAFALLEKIARQRQRLSRRYRNIPDDLGDDLVDDLALQMLKSVLAVDHDLTPMAAVAGTIADGVADFLYQRGMTRVIVNNGGDIAIRIGPDEIVKTGIRADLTQSTIRDVLTIGGEQASWGIATSGLEGRSLTRGVASAATVIAINARHADAAATSIANASYIEDETVVQKPAEQLDPQTDIPGTRVTIQAGPFTEAKKDQALAGAIQKTTELVKKDLILGAYIVVDGKVAMTDFVRRRLTSIN